MPASSSVVTANYETIERQGKKIAVITLQNAPVNSLSSGVREGIQTGLQNIQKDSTVVGVIIQGSNNTFCAGADISEFSSGLTGMFYWLYFMFFFLSFFCCCC